MVLVVLVTAQAHHLNQLRMVLVLAQLAMALVLLAMKLHMPPVDWVVRAQAATNHRHSQVVDTVVMLDLLLVNKLMNHQHQARNYNKFNKFNKCNKCNKYNNMQLMLKVYSEIQTHKSSVVQLQVAYKHTLKTFEFASFNHHQFHHQA